MVKREFPTVACAACHHVSRQDQQWKTLCFHCAAKIRTADYKASDVKGIRNDMMASGIPLGKDQNDNG